MRFVLTLVASSVILAACGGGSDGGGSAPAATPPPAPVATQATLTLANYVTASQETLSSSSFLTTTANLATGAQVSDPSVLVRFGQDQLAKLPRWFSDAPVQAVGAVQILTENCTGGGTLTISGNDANGNAKVDAGDSLSLTATNCAFEGALLNGKLALTINSVTGDVENFPYSLSVNLGFDKLTAKSSAASTVGNGSLVVTIDARATNNQSVSISTPSFALDTIYGATTYTKTLTNYLASESVSPAGAGFTSSSSIKGTLNSSAFESKSITLETRTPFVRSSTQAYPASGQLIITGAAGGKVRITASSATLLLIELDANADGTYEASTTKLWSDML